MLKLSFSNKNKHKLSKREISRFCSQLKMLLASGVPLLEALRIVNDLSRAEEYTAMIRCVSEGESLAASMRDRFPPMAVSVVEGAERAGNLEEALAGLSVYYAKRAEAEGKVKSALVYPLFVLSLCFLSVAVLVLFVLPGFKDLYVDLGDELPLFSRVIMGGGDVLARIWMAPFLGIVAVAAFAPRIRKNRKYALFLDNLFLRFNVLRREQITRAFRSLGALLAGGVPILEALDITARSISNLVFHGIFVELRSAVEHGERLSAVLSRHALFPGEAVQMLSVGENSGKLAEMLVSIADFYEEERDVFIKRATTLLEPALTLFVGVIVGVVSLAMFLPMINMISKLQ